MEQMLVKNGNDAWILQLKTGMNNRELKGALRKAALEYCRTPEGSEIFRKNGGLSYANLISFLSKDTLKKYGIQDIDIIVPCLTVDGAEMVLDTWDIVELAEPFTQGVNERRVCEIAVKYGEMLGTMETLEGWTFMKDCNENQKIRRLIQWAEQYVSDPDKRKDPMHYFKEKLWELRDNI